MPPRHSLYERKELFLLDRYKFPVLSAVHPKDRWPASIRSCRQASIHTCPRASYQRSRRSAPVGMRLSLRAKSEARIAHQTMFSDRRRIGQTYTAVCPLCRFLQTSLTALSQQRPIVARSFGGKLRASNRQSTCCV